MKISQAFPSKYLKVTDLKNRAVAVTIDYVELEAVGSEKEQKLVVHFEGTDKGFVLNKTNATIIEDIVGTDETDNWPGATIILKPTRVDFQGKRVDAIRVDRPSGAKPAPPPMEKVTDLDDDDGIPF